MDTKRGEPIIAFSSQRSWEEWLDANHLSSTGVWIKIARKDTGIETVTHGEALDVALCYGWIDGQGSSLDDRFWLLRFTPRGPRSKWSKVNCAKVLQLMESGRMRSAGLRAVERAQQDGRWERAYDPQSTASVPDDLQMQLDENPAAATFFANLDSRNRYAVLYRIQDAKRPETRARRITQFVAMLSRQEKLYP